MIAVILLILISLLQASLLSFDLIILVLIARSFLVESRSNYLLAFSLGLLVSLVSSQPLGMLSIFYLLVVKIVSVFKTTTFAQSFISLIPLTGAVLLLGALLSKLVLGASPNWNQLILQIILVLPIYLFVGFWEERWLGKRDLRLKI